MRRWSPEVFWIAGLAGVAAAALVIPGCLSVDRGRPPEGPRAQSAEEASDEVPRATAALVVSEGTAVTYVLQDCRSNFGIDYSEITGQYRKWEVIGRTQWAPTDCVLPMTESPHWSASDDPLTHGSKIYDLYVKHASAYVVGVVPEFWGIDDNDRVQPVGQVIVKEAWKPALASSWNQQAVKSAEGTEELVAPAPRFGREWALWHSAPDHVVRDTIEDEHGQQFIKGGQDDFFIMVKLDPQTPRTDDGWVYAVLAADGLRLKAEGMIESCIACHRKSPNDRMIGLKPAALPLLLPAIDASNKSEP